MRIIIEKTDSAAQKRIAMGLQEMGQAIVIDESATGQTHRYWSDREIRDAIKQVLSLFSVKSQWVAVYRVLVDYYGFPAELTSFYKRMKMIMKGVNCKFPCTYQSIQKTLASKSILQKSYTDWTVYVVKDGERFFPRQKKIADKLLELLNEM